MATGGKWTEEERELDTKIRSWPRTAENDPYREGLLALAEALRAKLDGAPLFVAYNEFCGPSIEDAVAEAIRAGATSITVVPEVEIPAILGELRAEHPAVTIRYAWPFDLQRVAGMLAEQVGRAV